MSCRNRRVAAIVMAWLGIAWAPAVAGDAWMGTAARFVALRPEQRRTGLDGVEAFFGAGGGWRRRRLVVDGGLPAAAAAQELGIPGVRNPRLAIWWAERRCARSTARTWPLTLGGRVGLCHPDDRDERVVLDVPGIEPIDAARRDCDAPVVSLVAGSSSSSFGRLRFSAAIGLMILRLNEPRFEGDVLSIAPSWRGTSTRGINNRTR